MSFNSTSGVGGRPSLIGPAWTWQCEMKSGPWLAPAIRKYSGRDWPACRSPGCADPPLFWLSASPHSAGIAPCAWIRSEEHTSELQSRLHLVCRLLLEKKKKKEHRI